jgi:hypothetical protein
LLAVSLLDDGLRCASGLGGEDPLDGLEGVERSDAHAMLSGRVAATHAGDKIVDDPASKSSLIVIGVLALAAPTAQGPVCPAKSWDRNLRHRFSISSCLYFHSHQISCAILARSSALVQYFQLTV